MIRYGRSILKSNRSGVPRGNSSGLSNEVTSLIVLQEWSNYVDAVLRYNDHGDLENVQKLIREND
jgi:hypothetical protein